ncbi:GNAT family N-acetyltransferase [Pseudarthrobacter psychrotolerans]|uniref:GNAT family N-acetyltransferase n=1 Tax=Pseudarthrobacter psychrotolerans TaxID=2697569 RepID=A0A6P1NIA3_9MICC|nr:GNAT family N-acetyltransferase [Pseudarthrobacter psychrotolerans]QHK18537.1 GNAT family N-acetyltransferase [Pseudarthrobacter psychrotolerans]
MDEAILERLEGGSGIFVAEVDGKLAGFAMTSDPGQATHNGPAVRALELAAEDEPTLRRFLYGPAAVSPAFQGQGILSGLLVDLSLRLQEQFDQGVAFVDHANERSLAVHRHFGMSALSSFELNGSLYTAFIFHPELFTDRLA